MLYIEYCLVIYHSTVEFVEKDMEDGKLEKETSIFAHKHTCCSCRPFCIIPRPNAFGPTPPTAGVDAKTKEI
jgi:hypothetical protein